MILDGVALRQRVFGEALDPRELLVQYCSIGLGRPDSPRPTIVPQGDGTLKLEYPA